MKTLPVQNKTFSLQESVRLPAVSYFFPAFLHGKLLGRKSATIFTKAGLHVFVCGLIEKLVWRKERVSSRNGRTVGSKAATRDRFDAGFDLLAKPPRVISIPLQDLTEDGEGEISFGAGNPNSRRCH